MRLATSPLAVLTSLTFCAALLTVCAAHADGLHIKVRGTAKIEARASRDQGELVLSGSLGNDAGQPLAAQGVVVRITRDGAADPRDSKVAEGLRGAHGCETYADRPRPVTAWGVTVRGTNEAPELLVITDEDGRFCFRTKLDADRYLARLHWADTRPGALLDANDTELPFDLSRRSLALSFDPRPRIVSLDSPKVAFDGIAVVEDDATPRVAPGLVLALSNEAGKELARVTTDASGRAHFALTAVTLGPPGRGELRVAFAGDAETAKSSHSESIQRRARVTVRVPAADRGELKPEVAEDGIPLVAEVTSVAGPVPEGSIEAHVGDVIVGAAPVERGIARVTVTFAAQGSEMPVALRYVPASPWFDPTPNAIVRVPIRPPGLLSKAPILLAGLAVLGFFLVGRVSSKRLKADPQKRGAGEGARDGRARIEVVRAGGSGANAWRGRITDAHEGTPVANARVWIERGTFPHPDHRGEGRSELASTITDARGWFELPALPGLVGDERIVAEGALHARLEQRLPGVGEVAVSLVLRRRAVLGRLVSWAKRRGGSFDAPPEPTPGHVRRAAGEDVATARWADAVERAVFGGQEVDARLEHEIDAMAPSRERDAEQRSAIAAPNDEASHRR